MPSYINDFGTRRPSHSPRPLAANKGAVGHALHAARDRGLLNQARLDRVMCH